MKSSCNALNREKFRVRVDSSHLACCLTTFHKPTLTFRKWNENSWIINLKIHKLKKELFWGTPSQWWHRKVQIAWHTGNHFMGSGSNRSLGLRESSLCWRQRGKRGHKKWSLFFPHHQGGSRGSFSKLEGKGVFPLVINLASEIFY